MRHRSRSPLWARCYDERTDATHWRAWLLGRGSDRGNRHALDRADRAGEVLRVGVLAGDAGAAGHAVRRGGPASHGQPAEQGLWPRCQRAGRHPRPRGVVDRHESHRDFPTGHARRSALGIPEHDQDRSGHAPLVPGEPHIPVMRAARKSGFTLPELLVSVVLGGIVLASVYKIMINQGRAYGKERELMDVRETVRSGATLLAWELRGAATGGSQLATMTADSLTLRAIQGFGIVCAKHATLPRYALWRSAGSIAAATYDQLTGPLLAPASGGLKFAYYDTLGAVTANAAALGAVGFTLRAQSLKQLHLGPGPLQYQVDSLTTRVALRR